MRWTHPRTSYQKAVAGRDRDMKRVDVEEVERDVEEVQRDERRDEGEWMDRR